MTKIIAMYVLLIVPTVHAGLPLMLTASTIAGITGYAITKNIKRAAIVATIPAVLIAAYFLHKNVTIACKNIASLFGNQRAEEGEDQALSKAVEKKVKEIKLEESIAAINKHIEEQARRDAFFEGEIEILSHYFRDQAQHDSPAAIQATLHYLKERAETKTPGAIINQ
jgi:hypothetical protein